MTNTTKQLMIATAFLTIAASIASAEALTADIPFPFRAGGKVMPAGAYRVEVGGSQNQIVTLKNFAARESVLMLVATKTEPPTAWKAKNAPLLSFECVEGRCRLIQLWNGSENPVIEFPRGAQRSDTVASIMEIRMVRNAD